MDFFDGLQVLVDPVQSQEVVVYFLVFHDGLNSTTREVTHIQLNQTTIQQYYNTDDNILTEIMQNNIPLALRATEGSFIGFAVPTNRSSNKFTQTINLSPTSEVEAHIYQLAVNFSEFEGRVLEAARTADSSQFTPQMIALPLIDITFSK